MTVGPNTGEVIRRILSSRKYEVQTYRMCQGVLSFTKKYSKQALEETCRQALELGKPYYSFIKKMCPVRSASYERQSRTAVGHVQRVEYIAAVII